MKDGRKENRVTKEYWEFVFCFFFTSQAGVIILIFQGITLLLTTGVSNIFMKNDEKDFGIKFFSYFCMYLYIVIMAGGYISAFYSAYKYKVSFSKLAAFFIGIGLLWYIILTIFSLLPVPMMRRIGCVGRRCPDHHWLTTSDWRDQMDDGQFGPKDGIFITLSFLGTVCIVALYIYTIITFLGFTKYIKYETDSGSP